MNCKNCNTNLSEKNNFCTHCGAKIITQRLNFKIAFGEFFATYISWDNSFFKTFAHLITKPQNVINGYLDGVRKKYMQPFAFMIIALTLYGIYMYFSKDIMMEYMDSMQETMKKYTISNAKTQKSQENFNKGIMPFLMKYHNLYTFASIPFLAIINRLIFKSRNYIEHNIALLYVYANFLIVSTILGFIGIIFNIPYGNLYVVVMLFLVLYHAYFYKKMFQLAISDTILKTLFFWLLIIVFYVFIIIIGGIIVFLLLKFGIISK